MKVLFQNDYYRVLSTRSKCNSKITIINFNPRFKNRHHLRPSEFVKVDEFNFITKKGVNGIFVQSRRNDWYQDSSIFSALDEIKKMKGENEIYITYGASMGGHAAVSFAPFVNADYFVAFAPQASLSSSFMKNCDDHRWLPEQKIFRFDHILRGDCQSFQGLVFVDKKHPQDLLHANCICKNTFACLIDCPGAWHLPAKFLNREFGLMSILTTIGELISNNTSVKTYLSELQLKIDQTFLARFMSASPQRKIELLCLHGMDRIRRDLRPNALKHEALVSKSPEVALIVALLLRKKDEIQSFSNEVGLPGLTNIKMNCENSRKR